MSYVEVYSDKILDLVSLGKTINDFNEEIGDYIKVEIFKGNSNVVTKILYSNRLLLKYSEADNYYIGDYHFHPENPEMGFCVGRKHIQSSVSNLKPIPIGKSADEPLNSESNYKKQLDIFKDSSDRIYIKPNDLLKLLNVIGGKYKFRIHFLRDIKSGLGNFLNIMSNNLIENGNFLAGLEATQTGDLDNSSGKNNIIEKENPGWGLFVLQQSGLGGNFYSMDVTGIEPNSNYVFTCWAAWDQSYNGGYQIADFINASTTSIGGNPKQGIITPLDTNLGGTRLDDDEEKRIINEKNINGLLWSKLYLFVQTDANADRGRFTIRLGKNDGTELFRPSTEPLGTRYFTDLRLEKVSSLVGTPIVEYINKFKMEN